MADMGEAINYAITGTDGLSGPAGTAAASLDKLNASGTAATNNFSNVATGAAKATAAIAAMGIGAVATGLAASVSAAADFEKQISAISAVAGEGAAGIDALRTTALQLGKDTSFSASEAAVGMEELVKAGVSVADVIGGAGRAALDLAAAGAVSVGEAAELASNAMNVFGISGANMGHVADVIAGAANASAISVTDYRYSLAAAGAVAATVGVGFEDLSTAIAVMGQAGIKGSDAGTSLKTMLLNLNPTSKAARSEMKELGIITADGANAFFTAEGKAKSLGEISEILKDKMAGLTKEQQINALQTMFGTDAIRAAAVMAAAGAKGFEDMAASIGKVSALDVANERLNNLAGSIEKMKGSAETFAIIVGSKFTPMLKGLADSAADGINSLITIFEDGWRTIEQVFAGDWSPSDAIDPWVNSIGQIAIIVRDQVVPVLMQFGSVLGTVAGFIADHTEIILGFGAAWATLSAIGAVIGTVSAVGAAIAFLASPIGLIVAAIGLLTAAWVGNWGDIQGKTASSIAAIQANIGPALDKIAAFWEAHGAAIISIVYAAWDAITSQISTAVAIVTGVVAAALQAFNGDWAGAWQSITDVGAAIWNNWGVQIDTAMRIVSAIFPEQYAAISTATTTGLTAVSDAWTTSTTAITTTATDWWTATKTLWQTSSDAINSVNTTFWSTGQGIWDAGTKAIQSVQTAAWNLLSTENQTKVTELQALFTQLWTLAGQVWTAGTAAISRVVTAWWTATSTEATTQTAAATATFTTWWAALSALWTTSTTAIARIITEWWTKISTEAATMMAGLTATITTALEPWVKLFTDTWASVQKTISDAATTLSAAAASLGTQIVTAITGAIQAKIGEVADSLISGVKRAIDGAKSLLSGFSASSAGGDARTYVAQAAARKGINPDEALKVMATEGSNWDSVGVFDTGTSYGPLQMHYAGGPNPKEGMGDRFTRDTGIDLRTDRSVAAQQKAIDYALDQAAQKGDWSEWYGADKAFAGQGGRFKAVGRVAPTGATGNGVQMMNQTQQDWAKNASDANSICGPYLAALFTDAVGRPPTPEEARSVAAKFGYGGVQGMLRNDTVDDIANEMIRTINPTSGMSVKDYRTTSNAEATGMGIQALGAGSPLVGINTAGHYYAADAYDPSSGKFHVGGTGTSISGGTDWMTVDQMTALMGPLNSIMVLTGQAGDGFVTMGANMQEANATGSAANASLLLSTTDLGNGASLAVTQMGNTVTATVTNAAGVVTGQWSTMVEGVQAATATMGTSVPAAVDIMTQASLVSVTNLGTGVMTTVSDMAGNTVTTITDMSGNVTSQIASLSDGTQVNMNDMATKSSQTVDTMAQQITTTVTDASGNVLTTITDMQGNVVDQFVTLQSGATTATQATATDVGAAVSEMQTDYNATVDTMAATALTSVTDLGDGILTITTDASGQMVATITNAAGEVVNTYGTMSTDSQQATTDLVDYVVQTFQETAEDIGSAVEEWASNLEDGMSDMIDTASDQASEIGQAVSEGIAEGIDDSSGDIFDAIQDVLDEAMDEAKDSIDSDSPSKLYRKEIGRNMGLGIALGIADASPHVSGAMDNLLTAAFPSDLDGSLIRSTPAASESGRSVAQLNYNQTLQVMNSPEDLQMYTERALRKVATEWVTS